MNLVCNWNSRGAALLLTLGTLFTPELASAEVVTLPELEELALQNQARWEAAEATAEQTHAEVQAARAGLKPSFWMNIGTFIAPGSDIERVQTVDGREVNVRASPTVSESTAFRPNLRYEGTIDMRVPLYNGRNRAEIKAAEAYRAAAQASSGASRETVLAMVRAAYLDWLGAHMDREFAARAAQAAREQQERVTARVNDGDRPPAELDAAEYEALQAELVDSNAKARVTGARRVLESAVGVELPPGAEPDQTLLEIDSEAGSLQLQWEVEALELESDAAREEARMFRKSRAPVLALLGQTGVAGVNERVFPMYRLGINLAVPLWDGGRAVSLAQAADARASELDARANDARLAQHEEHEQARLDRQHAKEQLALANGLVSVSEKRVDQAQTSYELGAGDLDSLADARSALRDAQSRRVQIQVALSDAVLRLDGED